jgi:hypothetical protein
MVAAGPDSVDPATATGPAAVAASRGEANDGRTWDDLVENIARDGHMVRLTS